MIFLIKNKPRLSTIILLVLSIIASSYFLIQIFSGEHNLKQISKNKQKLNMLASDYEKNNIDIKYYKKKIKSLSPETLDPDLLEEELKRKMLTNKDNELMVIIDQER
jgi:hypothetical protein